MTGAPRAASTTDEKLRRRRADSSRPSLQSALAAHWWLPAAAGIAWLTWPYPSVEASAGLDPSWAIALHLAAADRLDFGRDVVFTYGPLGFLSQPLLVTTATAIASFVFAAVAQVALCAVVLRTALRSFPGWLSVLLTYGIGVILAATGFSNLADYVVLIVFVLAVESATRDEPLPLWVVPAAGAATAFELLVKVNGGIVCGVLLVLVTWRCRPGGWRAEALLAVSFALALVAFWVASGSSLTNLPEWLRQSYHVVASYTSAQAVEAGNAGEYVEAVLLLVVAAAIVVAHVRALDRRRGLTLAAVALVYAFAYVKEGFIRHDPIHVTLFLAALALGTLAVTRGAATRWVAATLVGVCVGGAATSLASSRFLYRPDVRVRRAAHEVRLVFDGPQRRQAVARSRALVRAKLGLDAETVSLLQGHTVDVQPYETSAVWAYGLEWRPEPLLQSYMATDDELDLFNSHRLASHGADRILRGRETVAVDGKHPLFIAPEASLAALCRYREVHTQGAWEVLSRVRNRCGPARELATATARTGQTVRVPANRTAGTVVYARLDVRLTAKQRLASLLLKPSHLPSIRVGGATYRLVADTAHGPLLLRVPGDMDYPQLTVTNVASPFRVRFYAVPLARA